MYFTSFWNGHRTMCTWYSLWRAKEREKECLNVWVRIPVHTYNQSDPVFFYVDQSNSTSKKLYKKHVPTTIRFSSTLAVSTATAFTWSHHDGARCWKTRPHRSGCIQRQWPYWCRATMFSAVNGVQQSTTQPKPKALTRLSNVLVPRDGVQGDLVSWEMHRSPGWTCPRYRCAHKTASMLFLGSTSCVRPSVTNQNLLSTVPVCP